MGTSGDKIVLLDGMGSGSGSATNGLLSMILLLQFEFFDQPKHLPDSADDQQSRL
jgi:hypothetical protein